MPGTTTSSTTVFPVHGTRSTSGAARCGIDKMGPIVARGVLLDIVACAARRSANGASIGRADLEAASRAAGIEPGKGDVVLIRTGWQENQAGRADIDFNEEPGLDVEAGAVARRTRGRRGRAPIISRSRRCRSRPERFSRCISD